MKKFLLLSIVFVSSGAMWAQNIIDNFDDYTPGPVSPQADHWILWSAAVDDANVVDEAFVSPPHSLRVAQGTTEDVIFILGENYNSSAHRVGWRMMVPEGNTAYFNHQQSTVPGVGWNVNFYFNRDSAEPGIGSITDSNDLEVATFTYTEGQWMLIEQVLDLENDQLQIYVDQELVHTMDYVTSVGGMNFYSIDNNNLYYIDDIFFGEMVEAACEAGEEQIICDNFETYLLDSYAGENAAHWSTWSGTAGGDEDAQITHQVASSGLHSLGIYNSQVQDIVLQLGDRTEGVYNLKWNMYVPDSASGYYNIQQDGALGEVWVLETFFNNAAGVESGTGTIEGSTNSFTYPVDQWFEVEHHVNLDAGTISLFIDETAVETILLETSEATGIGAVNFYSLETNNTVFLDDFSFSYLGSAIGISENPENPFLLFPNPANEYIQVQSELNEQVVVQLMDLTGKLIKSVTLGANRIHQVDISDLSSGLYLVKMISDGKEYTQKLMVH